MKKIWKFLLTVLIVGAAVALGAVLKGSGATGIIVVFSAAGILFLWNAIPEKR